MLYDPLKTYCPEDLRGMESSELMTMFGEAKKAASIFSGPMVGPGGKRLKKIQADVRLIREILKG